MIPAGHEEEFRVVFAQEAEMRLTSLSQHLLALEEGPDDEELVASVFRDAHNLKGAAAVVGIEEVARVAHAMEDLLEQLRRKARAATPDVIDRLLSAADGLLAIIPAVLAGEDRSTDADAIEGSLRAAAEAPVAVVPDRRTNRTEVMTEVTPPTVLARRGAGRGDREGDTLLVPVSRLDELVRLVGESAAANLRAGRLVAERWGVDPAGVAEFRDLSRALNDLQERTMRAKMVPVATVTDALHRAVRDLSRTLGKKVRWHVRGGDTELDRSVVQQLVDPLLHLVRNAVDHGIEAPAERAAGGKSEHASLVLEAVQLGSEVIIDVSDDGRGIDVAAVRERAAQLGADVSRMGSDESLSLVFGSGLSTARRVSDVSGRGVGLDAVRAGVEAVRGRIEVDSTPGHGTRFRIVVPITLAVLSCLLVEAGGNRYALPMHSVVLAEATTAATRARAGGRPMIWVGESLLEVSSLARALWGDERPGDGQVVVVVGGARRQAFLVDRLIGQRDVVVKGQSALLPRLDVLAGASIDPDGSILLVLDVAGLVERARAGREVETREAGLPALPPGAPVPRSASVLVVDDSRVVRELERSMLERAGYVVRTADDGLQALARLAEAPSDLVITDVEMPKMDGYALTESIRASPRLANTPVLIVTSRGSEESRQRGLDAGADGYLVKSAFDEMALLGAVSRLMGRRP